MVVLPIAFSMVDSVESDNKMMVVHWDIPDGANKRMPSVKVSYLIGDWKLKIPTKIKVIKIISKVKTKKQIIGEFRECLGNYVKNIILVDANKIKIIRNPEKLNWRNTLNECKKKVGIKTELDKANTKDTIVTLKLISIQPKKVKRRRTKKVPVPIKYISDSLEIHFWTMKNYYYYHFRSQKKCKNTLNIVRKIIEGRYKDSQVNAKSIKCEKEVRDEEKIFP